MSRVLVVAPHPDDEVLGCGGSIALHCRAGRTVGVLYLTSGEHASPTVPPEELGPIRETEAVAATAVLGVPADALTWLRFPDGGLDSRDPGQLGAVMAVLRRFRPTLLYLPHPGDGSFDHREAAALCLRAAGMAGSANFPEWGGRPVAASGKLTPWGAAKVDPLLR
ncbi:PIG-L deacetylase family protein [Parafrankia sp. FMc2]|uniref:PIG-L deacetylase family protein n=1 Tax=Parafrankia sp. FMc2 TaxID=3233196 RepID=UPI0034D74B22